MLETPHLAASHRAGLSQPLGRFGLASVVGSALLLVAITAGSIWTAERSASVLETAQMLRQQRTIVANILMETLGAETGQRGYLLTGDASYLAPFQHAIGTMPSLLNRLAEGRATDPYYIQLRQLITAKLAEIARTVELQQGGDIADSLAIVRTNVGNSNMNDLRRLVTGLQSELDAKLLHEVHTLFMDDELVIAIDGVGLFTIALLGWQIAGAVRSYLARLTQAQAVAGNAYAQLERSNERLDEMVRARTANLVAAHDEIQRFAYIVSHDLRAPLVNIMGFTSEMEQASNVVARHMVIEGAPAELAQAATEDIPEALRFIRSSTSKMDRLINAILKLSREGRRVLTPEPLDMGGLFNGIVDTMQHQADSKDTTITVGALPCITADRLALEQIFGNLLDNALKYLRPGLPGQINIGGWRDADSVLYQVTDNGRGIAPPDQERVFELFRRAGDQTIPGEGIGLAHVRALVRRLGGTIACNSALDVGTTFTVRLPAVAAEAREIVA